MNQNNANPRRLTCSTCGRQYLLNETDSPPFCSERCKMIDLGRWLSEEVGMPHEGGPEDRIFADRPDIESENDE